MTSATANSSSRHSTLLLPGLLVMGVLVWSFGSTLLELVQVWRTNDQYSHGFLVPGFVLFLLWLRRGKLKPADVRPGLVIGSLLLGLGLAVRLRGAYCFQPWLEQISLVPCVAGLCWLLGGWAAWRWAWPAVLYLAFMIPLPFRLSTALSSPLQSLATTVSTFIMQAMGLPALSEGNVIVLNEARLNVVEACSGLRMLVVFVALSAALVLIVRRPLLDKVILFFSAVPIAVICNILRITATGVLHETTSSETANAFFHDFAGWMMPPVGLLLLAVELKLLSHLFVDPPPAVQPASRDVAPRRMPRQPAAPQTRSRPATARKTQQVPARPAQRKAERR